MSQLTYGICILITVQDEIRSCYTDVGKRPLQLKQNGGNEYSVNRGGPGNRNEQPIVVVIASGVYTTCVYQLVSCSVN